MKLANKNTIKDRATVKVPDDYNKTTKEHIELEWKRYGVEETKELLNSIGEGVTTEDEIIEEALINVGNVKGEDGKDLPYTHELFQTLMDLNYIRKPIINSFLAVQLGREALKQKN